MSRPVSKFSVLFVCKPAKVGKDGKAPIFVYVNVEGIRETFQLPLKCPPEDFKRLRNSTTPNPIKQMIQDCELQLQQIYLGLGKKASAFAVKNAYLKGTSTLWTLQNLYDALKEQKTIENVEPYTWNKYTNAFNRFLEFTNHSYSDDASTVTFSDVLLFEAKSMREFAETSTKKQMKNIKAFFSLGVASGKIPANPFGTIKIGHGDAEEDTAFLRYQEIKKIRDLELDSDRLKNVRWCFLFQCFSGLNYGDLTDLKDGDVKVDANGQYYIQKERHKRGRFDKGLEYTAVLYEDAVKTYKLFGTELPLISQQKYNDYIAELCQLAGIEKHITSKSGRKTYGNYLYREKKLPLDIIRRAMGHSNLRQTEEYVRTFDDDVLAATYKADEQLLKEQQSANLMNELAELYED